MGSPANTFQARTAELASSKIEHSPANQGTGKENGTGQENDNGGSQHANALRNQVLTPRTKRRRAEEAKKREERQKNERLEKGARQFEKRRQKEERKEAQRIALEKERGGVFQTSAQKKASEENAAKQALQAKEEARQEEAKKAAAMIKAVQVRFVGPAICIFQLTFLAGTSCSQSGRNGG